MELKTAPDGRRTYLAILTHQAPGELSLLVDLGFSHWKEIEAIFPAERAADLAKASPGDSLFITLQHRMGAGQWRVDFGEEKNRYQYPAQLIGLYDGDTVYLDIQIGPRDQLRNVKVRLSGIDTPEIRGAERPLGLISRDRVRDRLLGQQIYITTEKDKTGKFGRYLATIWHNGENVNQWLLDEGLAEPYE